MISDDLHAVADGSEEFIELFCENYHDWLEDLKDLEEYYLENCYDNRWIKNLKQELQK